MKIGDWSKIILHSAKEALETRTINARRRGIDRTPCFTAEVKQIAECIQRENLKFRRYDTVSNKHIRQECNCEINYQVERPIYVFAERELA